MKTKMEMELGLLNQTKITMNSSKLLNTYSRYPIEFVSGNGVYLYDTEGKKYIDFFSGIAVNGFGYNHPEIKKAVLKQLDNYWHVSNLYNSSAQETLAKKLAEKAGLESVFFSNTGTEAIEAAIKIARKFGNGKYEIISTLGSFHGRTMGSLSATGQPKFWDGFEPLVPGFIHVPYGDIAAIENAISVNTLAVLIETIQGEGGINVAPPNYVKDLREVCTRHGILLIIDEVQTGMGRTGKFFSFQHENIVPDIVASAKGLANGIPLGATIFSEKIATSVKPGSHGSTFGGNALAVAAANVVVDLLDEKTLNNISTLGKILMDGLYGLNLNEILEVRGKGLMIGVELKEEISCKKVVLEMLKKGFVIGTSGNNVIRLLPPYIITEIEISKFLLEFRNVVSSISAINN
jgi:predicted acetylornithine/succinylornithine family transaminase